MNRYTLCFVVFLSFIAARASASRTYTDVPADHWAVPSIDWVTNQGIMSGPNAREEIFDPSGQVNRAELATVITRLHNVLNKRIDALELQVLQLEYELTIERQRSATTAIPPVKK
jgi:hypothetical protein